MFLSLRGWLPSWPFLASRQAQAELNRQVTDLQALHELSSRLLEARTLPQQLGLILQALCRLHGAARGLVVLHEPPLPTLAVAASEGFGAPALQALGRLRVGEGACGLAVRQGRRVVVRDTDTDPGFAPWRELARQEGFRAVHSTPLVALDGQVMGSISVFGAQPAEPDERLQRLADICARKAAVHAERERSQRRAQRADERLIGVLASSPLAFGILEPMLSPSGVVADLRWVYANAATAALVGRELPPQLPLRESLGDDDAALEPLLAVAAQGRGREFEWQPPGVARGCFHVIASPVPEGVAVWFTDVTQRKRQEQLLRESDRRKDEFLATLAHELRNPLAPIRQAALVSRAPNATEAQRRWSHEVIDRQIGHMALLLDDLLDMSRITRGKLALRKCATELRAVLDAAIETARPLLDAKRHRLELIAPAQPVRFEADPLRLAQILSNLLTNAAKYTDPGGHIRLRAEVTDAEMVLSVADNGIGIAPEVLPTVFGMFSQVAAHDERSAGGLGIGLALARGLAELHGGRITARSDGPGQGSEFTLRVPRGRLPAGEGGDTAPAPSVAAGLRVLVADDNADARDSLATLLALHGHTVLAAADGNEALRLLERERCDVALLDIGMPGRDGHEVARALRQHSPDQCPLLVAVTGWGQDQDRTRSRDAGFDGHLTKPVDLTALLRVLERGRDPYGPPTPVRPGRTGSDQPDASPPASERSEPGAGA
ncbi:hybrid sensor histidine kinase/response regulator [Azohydromonas caseinilytica]|uniref:histidine kinase n=1 Tax=Azohydromonas caseinilytica TaxID=2728836 RepID=A0A848FEZ9_9BURK|nr:hybrid sensor histidine kinase/response regulator [Azohydromonas caseinilytica]NML17964.1 response regulator [Azohydromonas caseinilytica]